MTTPYDASNIFAKIIRGEIPCKEVYRDTQVIAFRDIQPAAASHVLVLPIGEYASFDDFVQKAGQAEVADFFKRVRQITHDLGHDQSGYRLIMNHGHDASQTVPHFHVHLLGGQPLGGLLAADTLVR